MALMIGGFAPFGGLDLVPFLLALGLSGLIGLEREMSGRPAGLRTHILVCLSSTMLIAVSREIAESSLALGAGRIVFDPNRMGAGIVTGIGFLGAATVLRTGDFLRGLTTAACIWFVAGLGIVLGTGHYALAVTATVMVLLVLTALNSLAARIHPVLYRRIIVHARDRDAEELSTQVRAILEPMGLRLLDVSGARMPVTHETELAFHVALKGEFQGPAVIERIAALEGVGEARWRQIS